MRLLVEYLRGEGVEQLVVCQPGSELERKCREAGLPFHPLRVLGEADMGAVLKLRALARKTEADILHTHTGCAHSIGLWLKVFRLNIKLVVSRRVDFHAGRNPLSAWKVDAYLAISENVKRVLVSDGVAHERIHVAYSGIDLDRFARLPECDYLRNEFGLGRRELTLGNVAALVDHKDQRTLVLAAGLLPEPGELYEGREFPSWRLFIVGDGELEGELKALARKNGLVERLVFTGRRRDIPAFLNLFDVFVMSSKEEGLGTSVLDAMACSLPVAATRAGGLPEMLDHEKGALLSPPGDFESLARSMASLLASPRLRGEFGEYNRARVRQFDRKNTGRHTVRLYKLLLDR